MFKERHFSFRRLLLSLLFCSSLLLCLIFGNSSYSWQQARGEVGAIATAQPSNQSSNLDSLQQGLERYLVEDFIQAIQIWQSMLVGQHPPENYSEAQVNALKYLVRAYQQTGQNDRAIACLNRLLDYYHHYGQVQNTGRMLTEQAQLYSKLGQQRQAIALLCHSETVENLPNRESVEEACQPNSALAIAQRTGDSLGAAAAHGSLGNAHRLRGDYAEALSHLQTSQAIAQQLNAPAYTIAALNGLGNTYASLAKRSYRQRQYAEQSGDAQDAQKFAQSAKQADQQAIAYFKQTLNLARSQQDTANELRALLNLILFSHRTPDSIREPVEQRHVNAIDFFQAALQTLDRLPNSQEKAFAVIRLATLSQLVKLPASQMDLEPTVYCAAIGEQTESRSLLHQAIAIAQYIQDSQSLAFALGRLGHSYECQQDYGQALQFTQQAQLADTSQDSRYLWEWQAGRILQAQGNQADAIAAYEAAVQTLRTIRADLAVSSRDFQFDFRDTVEPVYRELTALYLVQATKTSGARLGTTTRDETTRDENRAISDDSKPNDSKPNDSKLKSAPVSLSHPSANSQPQPTNKKAILAISSALQTIDNLRLAEVQNYLGDNCAIAIDPKPVTLVDAKTAVLSTVMLKDRIAIILSTKKGNGFESQIHWLPATNQEITATINELRLQLEKRSDLADTYQLKAKQLYDWLIRPFANQLQKAQIETLVFIQDGILRSIPMATLYDGNHFLVEQYAIASTPSLTLVEPTRFNPQSLKVLGFGLTQPSTVRGPLFFAPLSYVQAEIASIQRLLPGSKGLLDQAFTRDRLKRELTQGNYPIVHLATHGKFGIDSRDTFLVTGQHSMDGSNQRYNEKLTINQLYQMLRTLRGNTVELLTLTACETAVGSDRDALGIAGLSLQAGVRSTIASLWQVDDQSTA